MQDVPFFAPYLVLVFARHVARVHFVRHVAERADHEPEVLR